LQTLKGGPIKELHFPPVSPEDVEVEFAPRLYFEAKIDFNDVRSGFRETCSVSKAMEIYLMDDDALWTRDMACDIDPSLVASGTPATGKLRPLPSFVDAEMMKRMEAMFVDYLMRYSAVRVYRNFALNVYSNPGENLEDFGSRCTDILGESFRTDLDGLHEVFQRKIEQVREKCLRESVSLVSTSADFDEIRRASHWKSKIHAVSERIADLFLKTVLSKAGPDVESPEPHSSYPVPGLQLVDERLQYVEIEARQKILHLLNQHREKLRTIDEYTIHPNLKDVHLVRSCILWMPQEVQP
jgi:hypothetical protein